jgi:hypothetical protein
MYARGITTREIQGRLLQLYGIDVSPDLISAVMDAVLETVAEWQNRPRGVDMYPLVFFDVLRVKIRWTGSQQGRLCRTRRHARDILGSNIQKAPNFGFPSWTSLKTGASAIFSSPSPTA